MSDKLEDPQDPHHSHLHTHHHHTGLQEVCVEPCNCQGCGIIFTAKGVPYMEGFAHFGLNVFKQGRHTSVMFIYFWILIS